MLPRFLSGGHLMWGHRGLPLWVVGVCACQERVVEVNYRVFWRNAECVAFEPGSVVRPYREWKDEFDRSWTGESIDVDILAETVDGECIELGGVTWNGLDYAIVNSAPDDPEWLVGDPVDAAGLEPCPYPFATWPWCD